MEEYPRSIVFLDLIDPAEIEVLAAALDAQGLGFATRPGGERKALSQRQEPDLEEALHAAGADFVLVDGRRWSSFGVDLRHPARSYILVVLVDPGEEERERLLVEAGAFDCIPRGGADWAARAAIYFRVLSSLRRRFAVSFGALERRYEDLVHALPDIVYELDAAGRFTFINNSVRLLGYEPSELAGKHFSVLLHEEDARAVDRDAILDLFRGVKTGPALSPKLFNERRSIDRKTENLEVRLKRKPVGGSTPDDLIASVISYGEVTAAGEWARGEGGFLGSVGVIRDITLRRKSEEMLRKLYQAVDQLSAGVVVANRAFHIEYVNPAFLKISGRGPAEVIGQELFSFFEIGQARAEEIIALVHEGFDARDEIPLRLVGGTNTWTTFHVSPVRGPNGDVTHVIAICEDMSQRRAMEELLKSAKEVAERADRAKSDFLASMGHELRSPVASILAAARLIEMGGPEPEKRAETIIASAQSLLDLLGDILDFVRFETGSAVIRSYSFPLAAFVQRACEPFIAKASERGLSFDIAPLPEGLVHTDPDRLGRAFAALLSNALAFTEKGGIRVEAALERRSGNVPHLVLSIADTGVGIAVEDQGRIFAPFIQIASPFTKSGGAGIGLSLARNIVRALGGEVRLQSELGKGSVFTILVPAGEVERVESAPDAESKGAFRLLVVDDNEVNLDYMAALLKNAGHRVEVASNGAAALKLLEERPADAVILDIQMPGMSGIDIGRHVRSYAGDRYDQAIPLFALTAFDPEEVLSSEVDFDEVFSKPADIGALLQAVEKAIAERESEVSGILGRRWAGRVSLAEGALRRAEEEVPGLLRELEKAAADREGESLRKSCQALEAHFSALGALRTEAALRRLTLVSSFEDEAVLLARGRRIAGVWERLRESSRRELAIMRGEEG